MTLTARRVSRICGRRSGAGGAATALVVIGLLACAGNGAHAQDKASPADAKPAPASPAAPPFWARPRPNAPNCACDEAGAPLVAPATSRSPVIATSLLAFGALGVAFVLWRRLQKEREASYSTPSLLASSADLADAADGLDARVRAQQKAAARAAAAGAAPEDFLLVDPRRVAVELAESAPEAESAGAKAFYTEIAASLQAALRKEPARQDLRRKLLEIFFSARQVNEFVNLAHEYLDQNNGLRDQFWPEIGAMGARLAPEHELFREWVAGSGRAAAPVRRVVHLRRFHERNVDQGKLYTAQQALIADFQRLRADKGFQSSLAQLLADSVRRPAPLTASPELAYVADGAQIFVKHEDRRRFHDDVMINVMGQILLAKQLGRTRVVTATRDGIHGHAVAGAAARVGIESMIYIAEPDLNRYYGRVLSMRRLGAHLRPIPASADREAPDPRRVALDAWVDDPAKTQYISGLTAGATPFPEMIREFLATVGRETAEQTQQMTGALPGAVVAGVCDGHIGLGMFQGLLDHTSVQLYCIEEKRPPAPPEERNTGPGSMPEPRPCGHLTRREHRWLRETRRVNYVAGDDQETLRIIEQFHATGTTLFTESARTMAHARALARRMERRESVVVLLTNQEGADFRSQRYDW
jgi:tryptophan synthase beta subunit